MLPIEREQDDRQSVVEPLGTLIGQRFFTALVSQLAKSLGATYAFVGEFDPARFAGKLQTRAFWAKDGLSQNFAYDLEGTPCERVLEGGACIFPTDVAREFPRDPHLQVMGVESYAGIPLRDQRGQVIGLLVALHERPQDDPARLEATLSQFATRTELELERQRTEDALRESQEHLELALAGADLGTWDWNVEDGSLAFNARWAAMLGLQPQDIEPRRSAWEARLHPDDAAEVQRALDDHLQGRTNSFESEHRLRRKDGGWLWVLSRGRVTQRDEAGAALRVCGTQLDVSARRLAERERRDLLTRLLETQKLESLGVLAGGIAHDFNNLLTAILGNADLALSDQPPESTATENLENVIAGAQRAGELCRQLLAYSGQGKFRIEPLHLGQVIEEILDMLQVSISKKASLRLEVAPDLPNVLADGTQLRQVLVNLIANASESLGEDQGAITVAVRASEHEAASLGQALGGSNQLAPGRYVTLEVSDTGCGMSEETQRRLFEPFFTTKFSGRGLGLAAAQGIVRSHGGVIRVSSGPGVGTTFTILLPAADQPLSGTAEPEVSDAFAPGQTVLLVDDEAHVLQVATSMLECLGLHVIAASGGDEAVRLFRERRGEITLALVDLTMPEPDGAETIRELRAIDPGLPVLLTSGYVQEQAVNRIGQEPFGFLQKPYSLASLRQRLLEVLRSGPG